jgi:zinc protease
MRTKFLRLIAATIVLSSLGLAAQSKPAAPPKLPAPKIVYEKYTLPNGLEVILSEDHTLPLVAVNLWYHVGAANERAGRTGFAHLFEHMMFEGSLNVGEKSHFKYLEAAGMSDANGTTSFDRTNYYETLPSNQLALGLWLESDRMGFLLDTLTREKLKNQRDVVRNERRQTHENVPYGVANEAMYHALFPPAHPYYGDVIGSHEDIESARLNDVRDFFKTYYSPNNATLTIVGDFTKPQAKALVEKYFGPLQRGPAKPAVNVPMPGISQEKRITVTDQVQLPQVTFAWLAPQAMKPGDADLDLAQYVLGGGKTSRLYQELVYKQQIAQSAECAHPSSALASIFECEFVARPGTTPEQLETAANKVIDDFIANGPTEAELRQARTVTESSLIRPLEHVGSVADTLQTYNQSEGDPGYLPKDISRYEAVTQTDIKKWLGTTLARNKRVVIDCVPGDRKVEDVPQSPENTDADVTIKPEYTAEFMKSQEFRKSAPPAGPTPKLTLPVPVAFTLPNGLQVLVTERHKLPLFSAAIVTLAGADADSPKKPGVSGFTSSMLSEGTEHRSSLQIANEAAGMGAAIGAGGTMDLASVSISALTTTAPQAMDLLGDLTLHPAFAQEEIERVRARRLTAILQSRDQPMAIAQRVGARALYGGDSPYGYTTTGTEQSVKAITREDLAGFWKSNYAPKNSVLVFSGDITVARAKELAAQTFGGWTGDVAPRSAPTVSAANTHKIIIVDKPNTPQTALIAYQVGLPRSTPDYAATEVMNTMLGGLFSSRINMNLREAHGYTYGAFSQFAYRRSNGPFVAGASVRTDATAPAAKELLSELNRIHTQPLSAEELQMSKDSVVRSLPGQFETNGSLASAMAQLWVYKLPMDYYQALSTQLDAVTSAQAEAAATAHIHPEQMVIIAVGDKAKIEPGLKELNIAPIEEWTQDAEPKK